MSRSGFNALAEGAVVSGRYVVQKCLGVGSCAVVYRCRDTQLRDRPIALKVLFPSVACDANFTARFKKEILYSYQVNHPNVVRTYDFIEEPDLTAITMEYVDGGDLLGLINSGELSIESATEMFIQICSGVEAIHGAGIVHRDLKPENVLLTKDNIPKIADFSIAWTRNATKLTDHGSILGSVTYVSPEYFESGKLDSRADIYALGVIGYEMLTGKNPNKGHSIQEVMRNRAKVDVQDLSAKRSDCPAELGRMIAKAMNPNPKDRYQKAAEMRRDLEQFSRLYFSKRSDTISLSQTVLLMVANKTAEYRSLYSSKKSSRRIPLVLLVTLLCLVGIYAVVIGIPNFKAFLSDPPARSTPVSHEVPESLKPAPHGLVANGETTNR
jgi:serine/threonine protein kinase